MSKSLSIWMFPFGRGYYPYPLSQQYVPFLSQLRVSFMFLFGRGYDSNRWLSVSSFLGAQRLKESKGTTEFLFWRGQKDFTTTRGAHITPWKYVPFSVQNNKKLTKPLTSATYKNVSQKRKESAPKLYLIRKYKNSNFRVIEFLSRLVLSYYMSDNQSIKSHKAESCWIIQY